MTEDQFGKILDRFPFLDGSGRRRFVAGGIILIGIAAPNWGQLQTALGGLGVAEILGSPLIAAGAVLMVYAIGSLADMVGELFFVRAASGIFWAFRFPNRLVKFESKALSIMTRSFLFVFVAPFIAFIFVLYGFIGRTRYTVDIEKLLYPGAQGLYRDLPHKVTRGLSQPVGDDAEFAQKYIIDQLQSEPDRKWARRIFARAKDVAATITALQIIVLYMILTGPASLFGGDDFARYQEEIKLMQTERRYRDAVFDLSQIKLRIERTLKEQQVSKEEQVSGVSTSINELKALEKQKFDTAFKMKGKAENARLRFDKLRQERYVIQLLSTLVWLPFLLLYLGYFTTLRNAITATLEALVPRSPAPAGNALAKT